MGSTTFSRVWRVGAVAWVMAQAPLIGAEYQVGDVARAVVVSPLQFSVVDPEGTERLRQEAMAKVPWIFRFEAQVGREVEHAVRESFQHHQQRFLSFMEQAAQRRKLDLPTVGHPSFARFVEWFRTQHPDFPLSDDLSRRWALQESSEAILETWLKVVRQAMGRCICPEAGLLETSGGSGWIRVAQANASGEKLTDNDLERSGVDMKTSELWTLAAAKARLVSQASPSNTVPGVFLSGFLRANCFPELELTRRIRQRQVADLLSVDHYQAGDVIVHRGERVTARVKAALELLRTLEVSATTPARPESASLWQRVASGVEEFWWRFNQPSGRLEFLGQWGLWILAGLSVAGMAVLGILVSHKRRRRRRPPMPVSRDISYTVVLNPQRQETVFVPSQPSTTDQRSAIPETSAITPAADPLAVGDAHWQQRALEAERRAEEILSLVRAGLAPQLARQMMHRLVQELITQRRQWLQTQRLAEQDLAQIERRFVQSHDQLFDRLRAFEKRTEDLERALAVKTAENTELIKAHMHLTQKQLESKQSTSTELLWN